MNPIKFITRPVRDLTQAIVMPFKALFVVGLCFVINWMTSPGHWWVQWVALGMGIAVLVAWARAAQSISPRRVACETPLVQYARRPPPPASAGGSSGSGSWRSARSCGRSRSIASTAGCSTTSARAPGSAA